ncbi:hypothetical protein L1D13_24365 [Vibrio tubiashii]|uniref:hypothetical protein n=1 Tax=Vibrio oreintalis group TaxID=1891919 RepID=UPI001EFE28AB|nr:MULTISPECIES: hypothetical protein [Vibrio oreintalis group]MCG9583551.1 hypothetical protein [Vibrio tubiashii]MCG9617128.1 hypothetical protein [Vibrio tubiashii]MCG9690035.1 hypothetical protein [Vibrio tubiashii]MCG9753467.1 hypothetical protein [Vibrio brasiliensis]
MKEPFEFVSEVEFRKDIEVLAKAIRSSDMKPLVLFGENGIGKSPVLEHIGGVHEIYRYGSPEHLDQAIRDIIVESLERGFNQDDSLRSIQHVFSINHLGLFNEIKKTRLFRCFTMRRTSHTVLTSVLSKPL